MQARWFCSRISRFDFNLALGAASPQPLGRGLTGTQVSGSFYPTSYLASAWTCATSC